MNKLISELRSPHVRFIFQGGSEYALKIADELERLLGMNVEYCNKLCAAAHSPTALDNEAFYEWYNLHVNDEGFEEIDIWKEAQARQRALFCEQNES